MTMQIFEQILIIFLLIIGALPLFWWRWRQRLKYLQKIAKLNILKRQQKSSKPQVFITYIIDVCVRKLYMCRNSEASNALAQLASGRISAAVRFLKPQEQILAALLSAHNDAVAAIHKIEKIPQKQLIESRWFLFAIIAAQNILMLRQANRWFGIFKNSPQAKIEKAYYNLSAARQYMQKGDMTAVSVALCKAMPLFHRYQYFIEEAACYMLLVDAYRVSGMTDMAEFLLTSIHKIYQKHNLPLQQTEITAMRGMLMTSENRYIEAENYYEQALQTAPNFKIQADILNQYALLEIHQQKYANARKKIKQALPFYDQNKNFAGVAFCLQLLGQIAFEKGKLTAAVKYLKEAAANYYDLENFSAYGESLYLCAEAYFQQQKFEAAEYILKEILTIISNHQSNFHLGHVYGLLGLVYMQLDDLPQARTWLKKSLWLEQNTQRYTGAAVDCLNLALLEETLGYREEAQQYSKEALEYAQKTEDKEFIDLVKSKMLR